MFRNFYAEQKMADPRDSWYRPNLLYNIHYRPPKPPTPLKMMVVTKEFNPSVCTCGEHSCVPQYRMEREVVWSNKEMKTEEGERIKQKIEDLRNALTDVEYGDTSEDDGDSDDDSEEACANEEGWESDASCKDRSDDINVMADRVNDNDVEKRSSTLIMAGEQCEEGSDANIETQRDNLHPKISNAVQDVLKLEQRTSNMKSELAKVVLKLDDFAKPDKPKRSVNLVEDDDDCGSAFGIMRVYCESELHTSWNQTSQFKVNE
ncbi:uncharacterized protein LOC123545758 [Mercenaria mercenaria]|uniref:uncharacterized protein LOC123545758 n=1 Tax=Mercenaria mercenaria TaxID=6596 RepID=UPI00234F9A4D|nr:uncharacterized protein LOC123545758 [Mercenaria mercenaria]